MADFALARRGPRGGGGRITTFNMPRFNPPPDLSPPTQQPTPTYSLAKDVRSAQLAAGPAPLSRDSEINQIRQLTNTVVNFGNTLMVAAEKKDRAELTQAETRFEMERIKIQMDLDKNHKNGSTLEDEYSKRLEIASKSIGSSISNKRFQSQFNDRAKLKTLQQLPIIRRAGEKLMEDTFVSTQEPLLDEFQSISIENSDLNPYVTEVEKYTDTMVDNGWMSKVDAEAYKKGKMVETVGHMVDIAKAEERWGDARALLLKFGEVIPPEIRDVQMADINQRGLEQAVSFAALNAANESDTQVEALTKLEKVYGTNAKALLMSSDKLATAWRRKKTMESELSTNYVNGAMMGIIAGTDSLDKYDPQVWLKNGGTPQDWMAAKRLEDSVQTESLYTSINDYREDSWGLYSDLVELSTSGKEEDRQEGRRLLNEKMTLLEPGHIKQFRDILWKDGDPAQIKGLMSANQLINNAAITEVMNDKQKAILKDRMHKWALANADAKGNPPGIQETEERLKYELSNADDGFFGFGADKRYEVGVTMRNVDAKLFNEVRKRLGLAWKRDPSNEEVLEVIRQQEIKHGLQ